VSEAAAGEASRQGREAEWRREKRCSKSLTLTTSGVASNWRNPRSRSSMLCTD